MPSGFDKKKCLCFPYIGLCKTNDTNDGARANYCPKDII